MPKPGKPAIVPEAAVDGGNGLDPESPSWLVVVGSSAGGIQALSELLGGLNPEFPAPIVVAQHTQPDRVSHLAEILRGRTRLGVELVERETSLRPGTVYVVPADRHVVISDSHVEPRPGGADRPVPSIDRLLESAAEAFGERLIAVILSGMGSDGVVGAGEVKTRGGTVVIQNPETASHPTLPRALPPTLVDFVADAERIGELLVELVNGTIAPAGPDDERLVTTFLNQLRERTGVDFGAYKRPTILRRLQRRMLATGNTRLRDYIRYAGKSPDEYRRVASSFLIKVTQFFRDPELFSYLRETLVPALLADAREADRELRIWSAGCATGEEAYSLAILLREAQAAAEDPVPVRIFATDLDEEAVAFARRGVYPESVLANIPPDVVERDFIRHGDGFEVAKPVRSLVVFGQHDLGYRSPFPRIDLVLCRNVLIYFTPELQKRALQLFAFSLREGGHLVLGKAELTTPYAEHFILDQPRLKIYRRSGDGVMIPPAQLRQATPAPHLRALTRREPAWATEADAAAAEAGRRRERADEVLLRLPVGVVVVDRQYDILSLNLTARRLLGIHGTGVGHDFVHLSRLLPSHALLPALDGALGGESSEIQVESPARGEEEGVLRILFQPSRHADGEPVDAVIVTVLDMTATVRERRDLALTGDRQREDLERQRQRLDRVAGTNRELLRANEELTNANASLRSTNEELLVANEEVQAATEEVETLNEELQATNEELETLNEELQATVEELNTTNDDLEARSAELTEAATLLGEQRQRAEAERQRLGLILDGMSDAVLVVDLEGRTVATNRAYQAVFGTESWTPEDEAGVQLPEADWPQARAGRGEAFSMSFTVSGAEGRRWFEASSPGPVEGRSSVVVLRDITDRNLRLLQERFIATASHELRTPLAALHGDLQLLSRMEAIIEHGDASSVLDEGLDQIGLMRELIERLLDVSRLREGTIAIDQEDADLSAIVRRAASAVRAAVEGVTIDIAGVDDGVRVGGDAARLRQAVTNLLENAATHGRSDGMPVDVSLSTGDQVVLTVADRGPGIPPEVRGRLFLPFAAGEAGATRGGLGLGLYLTREIVLAHGGTIALEDRGGGGTLVTVRLPRAPTP